MKREPNLDVIPVLGSPHRKLPRPTTKAHNASAKESAIAAAKVRAAILRGKP